jgi:pyruvate,water dikinase
MKSLFSLFKKRQQASINGYEPIKALFSKFRMILELNTQFLEKVAEMETSLGGEFVFDSAYLKSSLQEINRLVYQVIYSLNALTNNRYIELFDRFQTIKATLENIVEGGFGPFGNKLTVPLSVIRWEMGPLIGQENACLGEINYRLGHRTRDGFVVTVTAYRRFIEENDLVNKIHQLVINAAEQQSDFTNIQELVKKAVLSEEVEQAIQKESVELFQRRGADTPLSIETSVPVVNDRDFSKLVVRRDFRANQETLVGSYKNILAGSLLNYLRHQPEADVRNLPPVAVAFQEILTPRLQGTIRTITPENSTPAVLTIKIKDCRNKPDTGTNGNEEYVFQKSYPFGLLESKINPKPLRAPLPDGGKTVDLVKNNLLRGSALIGKEKLVSMVELGVEIERIFGPPQQIDWIEEISGQRTIMSVTPVIEEPSQDLSPDLLTDEIQHAILLLEGGETAQVGTASGRIIHVSDCFRPEDFPVGCIAVTRHASPQLSSILRRAGAMVTEIGSPAGHLATVAREFRIPTIVGARYAMDKLREGSVVTIDAEECKVYQGTIPSLLTYRSLPLGLLSVDPEYTILRQLLRWIVPLKLIDPESSHFSPDNCQSLHDIIHFSHEKAVDEIVNLHRRHKQLKSLPTRSLVTNVPLNIAVLDMLDGISPSAAHLVMEDDIASMPFKALLRGLLLKDAWDQEPASLSIKDIVSGMTRTQDILTSHPNFAGQNLAIISREYLNLSLRLGYHFNVVDTYLSKSINENYIYFRFVGGFADPDRRHNRALLIRLILEHLDFKVKIKGDLVVGKLKMEEFQEMEFALERIGELIAYTRQLDIKLVSEDEVNRFFRRFAEKTKRSVSV